MEFRDQVVARFRSGVVTGFDGSLIIHEDVNREVDISFCV